MKKTIMVHIDGIPAQPFEELNSQTLFQAAQIPHLDDLAQRGELGRIGVSKEPRTFGGELAFLGLLGYDTQKWYVGPGTFEGVNLEVVLDRNDVAFLCDFVTLRAEDGWGDGKKLGSALVMDDVSCGGLETEEAREFIDAINDQLVSENIQFYLGHEARHLMVWVGGNAKISCRNPREALGQSIIDYLPSGEGSQILRELMEASRAILRHHPVNQDRVSGGSKPANCLWPWGQSRPVELTSLQEQWAIQGVVVSSCGPYRGVGMASGLKAVTLEGNENHSDRLGKMAAIPSKVFETQDLACLHVPCMDLDIGLSTPAVKLVEFLEQIDLHLIGPLQQTCAEIGNVRLFVVATAAGNKTGIDSPLSSRYVLFEGGKTNQDASPLAFHDPSVLNLPLKNATSFFTRFFGKK